jgi:hypothetical protein
LHPLVDDLPCPVIQYADDTLLILRAEHSQVRRLRELLDLFSQATGLHINFHKSTFVPVGGVTAELASDLANILGCPVSSFPQTYLGLPLSDHKLPAAALEFLSVKISKRIPGWRTSLLPIGGRLTLTTAVLSALPSFAMSVLPIPKGTLSKMDRPRRAMLWKAKDKCSGGDCQVAWDYVCRLRSEGGLGVIDLGLQNKCLLLKALHGLFTGRDSPWTRWVKRSYLGARPQVATPAWKCFQSLIPLYRSITRVEPRDGRTTSLWHDAWTPLGPLSAALPAAFSHCLRPLATVADALENGAVEVPLVHRVSAAAAGEMEFIHACLSRISLTPSPDIRSVSLGPLTDFSTGSVYRSLHSSGCIVPGQDVNWACFAPLKVRVFFWILRLHKTRTRALLHRIGCVASSDCPFCPNQLEDTSHLFVGCPRLRPLWNVVSPSGRPHVGADVPALLDALSEDLPSMHPEARNTVILALLWTVWKSRNRMVFDADFMSTPRILAMLVDHLRLWVIRAPLGSTRAPCCLGARLSLRLCLSPCPVFPLYPAPPISHSHSVWARYAAPDLFCRLYAPHVTHSRINEK